MRPRDYYSTRTGKVVETPELNLRLLKKLFLITYNKLNEDGYFQKYFGYYCVDQGNVSGELGHDIDAMIFLSLKKENLWQLTDKLEQYSEDDLFDMIEFLHDNCAKPVSGTYHSWNDCGYHYTTFNDELGRQHFREKIGRASCRE